ncbi:DegT/DnrJ/EryC1/StrS family aminotransferase [Desulfobacula toluolica]|uniref:ArnB2: UDP-4-amino-4-deoxy-L-arabinose--oxoglutarate aminotransferase n=1 Tax=Desulfobacula toluolica (strain DSM 7467 / Tol2) TaxID=651182 RepID=K0NBI8_DESTT|nr:DegT/DnrJ/EryC1/StrS family aminotransferase [Desulfobacula toluolica]CCK81684.1 ArnB2: UDP-4-amino-4-deoxy-L-arabinose--oxoglutarate aminotransferase [Desulfobacula toluolica Tol2]
MKIDFFYHNLGEQEREAVYNALESPFLTTGSTVLEFEKKFSQYIGSKHTIAVMSCTAALHLSLQALGIGKGDEVITTPMTFAASSLAIVHTGATPVWVDVEANTGNIDVKLIEAAITKKTKAILPVHLYGQMCDMRTIRDIANQFGLFIIEDAAHALESSRDGIRIGELSDAACFSFYATKSITCGEGGAVSTNSQSLASKIHMLRSHGINKDANMRHDKVFEHWDLIDFGWKYNMNNIQASILIPQIDKIDHIHKKRKEIYGQYMERLVNIPELKFPQILPESISAYHLLTIWVAPNKRDKLLRDLQKKGIGVAVNYRSINILSKFQNFFSKGRGSFPISEKIGDSTISLPFHTHLTQEEINHIISMLKELLIK